MTDILQPASGGSSSALPQGYVVLVHGLAANKRIMSYIAKGFAAEGMRVFVPDMPGHGRTPGPFSYERSEVCTENLVRELTERGLLDPEKTLLAGHSLGGADALRAAVQVPVAGVIAISPAPMRPTPGLSPEMLPFHEFGKLPAHSLVMSGGWEPWQMRNAAKELVPIPGDTTSEYVEIPRATHVSILFSPTALSTAEKWAALTLRLKKQPVLGSRRNVLGFIAGFAGILLLAGPFLRETLSSRKQETPATDELGGVQVSRSLVECGIVALGAVGALEFVGPLRALRLFEGDYFAGFLLILGIVLLALHWKSVGEFISSGKSEGSAARPVYVSVILAAFVALLLYFLTSSWIELTVSETWLTVGKWARFGPFFLAALPYHAAEELLLGRAAPGESRWRVPKALALRLIAWCAIVAALFFLRSGEILPVILAPYLGIFCVFQTWGMKVVREVTASGAATAIFGAILLAGYCLVVFPTT